MTKFYYQWFHCDISKILTKFSLLIVSEKNELFVNKLLIT